MIMRVCGLPVLLHFHKAHIYIKHLKVSEHFCKTTYPLKREGTLEIPSIAVGLRKEDRYLKIPSVYWRRYVGD